MAMGTWLQISWTRILSSRTYHGWLVWQIVWEFANRFAPVEAVFIDTWLAGEHSFARFNSCLGAWLLEIVGRVVKEVLTLRIISLLANCWIGLRRKHEPLKVRMFQSLLRGNSLLGIKCHHLHHEVDCLLTRIWNELTQRSWNELWESEINLSCELVTLWPFSLRWTTKDCTCFVNLVSFIISWE